MKFRPSLENPSMPPRHCAFPQKLQYSFVYLQKFRSCLLSSCLLLWDTAGHSRGRAGMICSVDQPNPVCDSPCLLPSLCKRRFATQSPSPRLSRGSRDIGWDVNKLVMIKACSLHHGGVSFKTHIRKWTEAWESLCIDQHCILPTHVCLMYPHFQHLCSVYLHTKTQEQGRLYPETSFHAEKPPHRVDTHGGEKRRSTLCPAVKDALYTEIDQNVGNPCVLISNAFLPTRFCSTYAHF